MLFPIILIGGMLLGALIVFAGPWLLYDWWISRPIRYEHWTDAEAAGMFDNKSGVESNDR